MVGIIGIGLLVSAGAVCAAEGDTILGYWITEGGDSCVEIIKQEERYFANIVALRLPNYEPGEVDGMDGKPRVDLNNPDESLRSQPLLGLELMKNFTFTGEEWTGGRIYDPDNGKTYKCKMSVKEDGVLNVRGFIGVSLLGRTTQWIRPEIYEKIEGKPLTCECPAKEE